MMPRFSLLFISTLLLSSCQGSFFKVLSSSYAKEYCSCYYVVGQSKEYCQAYSRQILPVSSYDINESDKKISAKGLGFASEAKFIDDRKGCEIIL